MMDKELQRLGWESEDQVFSFLTGVFEGLTEEDIKEMGFFCLHISEEYKDKFKEGLEKLEIPYSEGEEDGEDFISIDSPIHAAVGIILWNQIEKSDVQFNMVMHG